MKLLFGEARGVGPGNLSLKALELSQSSLNNTRINSRTLLAEVLLESSFGSGNGSTALALPAILKPNLGLGPRLLKTVVGCLGFPRGDRQHKRDDMLWQVLDLDHRSPAIQPRSPKLGLPQRGNSLTKHHTFPGLGTDLRVILEPMCRLDPRQLVSRKVLDITVKKALFAHRAPPAKISFLASAGELGRRRRFEQPLALVLMKEVRVASTVEFLAVGSRHTERAELTLKNPSECNSCPLRRVIASLPSSGRSHGSLQGLRRLWAVGFGLAGSSFRPSAERTCVAAVGRHRVGLADLTVCRAITPCTTGGQNSPSGLGRKERLDDPGSCTCSVSSRRLLEVGLDQTVPERIEEVDSLHDSAGWLRVLALALGF